MMNMEYLHIERPSTEYLKDLMLYKEKAEKIIHCSNLFPVKKAISRD